MNPVVSSGPASDVAAAELEVLALSVEAGLLSDPAVDVVAESPAEATVVDEVPSSSPPQAVAAAPDKMAPVSSSRCRRFVGFEKLRVPQISETFPRSRHSPDIAQIFFKEGSRVNRQGLRDGIARHRVQRV